MLFGIIPHCSILSFSSRTHPCCLSDGSQSLPMATNETDAVYDKKMELEK